MRVPPLAAAALLAAALLGARAAGAQRREPMVLELRPILGAYHPMGAQRDVLGEGFVTGGQGAAELSPRTAVVGTFAVARSPDRLDPTARRVRVVQYDLGVERSLLARLSDDWLFKPFLGAGLGFRSYTTYRDSGSGEDTRVEPAGYAAAGLELQTGKLGLRAETRGYLSRYSGLAGEAGRTARDDALALVGVAFHLR